MAQLVIRAAGAAVGAVAGFYAGNPVMGAQIGWALGGAIAGSPTQKVAHQGQPLIDLRITGAEYGQPITYLRGSQGVAGQMWWNTERRPTNTSTTTESGGKGGGGGVETTTSTTTYDMDCLIGLTDNEIVGIARIWDNGKLIWSSDEDATAGTVAASAQSERWTRLTVYTGAASQLPDPTYEAAVGAANAPAYRGRGYVFIESLKLGQSGQIPNLTFEVVADGAVVDNDGTDWTIRATPAANAWKAIEWGNDVFVAVSSDAAGGPQVMRSTDRGVTWTSHAAASAREWWDIAFGRDVFVAVAEFASGVMTSADNGQAWTTRTAPSSNKWQAIAFGDDVFVGVSTNASGGEQVMRSVDAGATWDEREAAIFAGWKAIAFGNHVFVALSGVVESGAIMISTDLGLNWTSKTQPAGSHDWADIAFGNGVFVAVDLIVSANQVMISTDNGETWTAKATPISTTLRGVTFGNDVFTAVTGGATYEAIVSRDNGETWELVDAPANTWNKVAYGDGMFAAIGSGSPTGTQAMTAPIDLMPRISAVPPTVAQVVSDLCLRAGLTAGQIDVTALSSITRTVRSLALSQIAATRSPLELLMSIYFFEAVVSEKIKFVPRGGAAVATIPYLDLGASMGDDQPEPLALKQSNDLEMPAQIALSYINISDDYQTDTQLSDRLISAVGGTVEPVSVAIGMTPSEAKAVADTWLLDRAASVISAPIALLGDYCRLEPTDPVVVTDQDGSTFRMRLVRKTDSYPLLAFEAVLDDVSVLTSQGITSADYTSSTVVAPPVDTLMELMDIPILRDADNDAGFYVATKGDGEPYPGSAVFNSPDDVTYTRKATVLESAVFGTCQTTLGNWTGPRIFDEANSVRVDVGEGALASSTRTALLNDLSINAMLIGSEIIQFRTATIVSSGVYTLTGLLRGGRGTEWAMVDHAAGERCVLLREAGLRRIVLENNELGLSRYYKGVTLGRAVSSAESEQFTDNAVGLKPFSPFDSRISRDASNNATITWQRRSRLSVRTIGALGISVPLGEDSEAYALDIYSDGTYATVVDELPDTATTTAPYSAADQTAAGLTPGNTIYHGIRQVSQQVGEGYELRAAA